MRRHYTWPLIKFIAASTESSKVGCSEANAKETNHQFIDSKDNKAMHILLNEQLIAAQSSENETRRSWLMKYLLLLRSFLQVPLTNIE